jgi:hypothetical protein
MTKAAYEAEWGPGSWDLVSEDRQMERCRYMSAGLMAEFELPTSTLEAVETAVDACRADEFMDVAFSSILRDIATEGNDV